MNIRIYISFLILFLSSQVFSMVQIQTAGDHFFIISGVKSFSNLKRNAKIEHMTNLDVDEGYCAILYPDYSFIGEPEFFSGIGQQLDKNYKSMHVIKARNCSKNANLLTYAHSRYLSMGKMSFPVGFNAHDLRFGYNNREIYNVLKKFYQIDRFELAKGSCLVWYDTSTPVLNHKTQIFTSNNIERVFLPVTYTYFESIELKYCRALQSQHQAVY